MTDDPHADVAARYTVQTTPFLEGLMAGAGADDPLARQFRPSLDELVTAPDDLADPIGDEDRSPLPGLVHRYPDRVLLLPVKVCAAYCRFCFRRAVVGRGAQPMTSAETTAALDYIRARPAIWEVILSGGDPLLLSPRRLRGLVAALADIPHVETLRVHTRLPIHDPDRVTVELAESLAASRLAPWLAVHVNHAREFAPEVLAALGRLRRAGVALVSQSVLLRGVNDDVDTLEQLFRACVRYGIKPYYLHHPDRAEGTSHFRLSIDEGRALVAALHARLSGLARPTYVLDRPGGLGKVPLGPYPTA
ncbi:MAG: lysine-2,3-aminomutase-like protein [Rhodospirillaceae bacterium]